MTPATVSADTAARFRDDLDGRLVAAVAELEANGQQLTRQDQRILGASIAQACLADLNRWRLDQTLPPLDDEAGEALIATTLETLFGADVLEPFLVDDTVREVRINGHHATFVVRTDGTKERHPPLVDDPAELVALIQGLARRASGRAGGERRFDAAHPVVDLQLPGGHRFWATMEVSDVPYGVLRRHDIHHLLFLEQLGDRGMFPPVVTDFLRAMVAARFNAIIGGGTGVGKTTLLRACCNEAGPEERLIIVEDSPELGLDLLPDLHPDHLPMCRREENVEGAGGVSLADLVRSALRGSPDRIVCGECRGNEVLPMLWAMTQGNEGSMSTVHARSSVDVFSRLALYAAMTEERIPFEASAALVAAAVDLVVFVSGRRPDGPGSSPGAVTSIREITGREGSQVTSNEVVRLDTDGRILSVSSFQPATVERLRDAGFDPARLGEVGRW